MTSEWMQEEEKALALESADSPLWASPEDFRRIQQDPAWKDIKRFLMARIINFRNDLEEIPQEDPGRETILTRLQAQLWETRLFVELPERLAIAKEQELEDGQKE